MKNETNVHDLQISWCETTKDLVKIKHFFREKYVDISKIKDNVKV